MIRRIGFPFFLVAVMLAFAASPAFGGKSSITLVRMEAASSATAGGPYFGEQVMFATSTDRTEQPWVQLSCYQGGELVYAESHPAYQPNRLNDPGMFTLGPSAAWTGGAADCRGDLFMVRNGLFRTLARHVLPRAGIASGGRERGRRQPALALKPRLRLRPASAF